jgi:[heparan sulfate]-glucosamine 3-sulfotransferase 5
VVAVAMNHKFQLRALLIAVYSLFGLIIFSRYFGQSDSIEPAYSDGYRFEYGKLSRNLPDCIIIGVIKGGTRALLEYINMHADVEISLEEVHFFNVESQYLKGYNWYRCLYNIIVQPQYKNKSPISRSRMPLVRDGQLSVEKSPNYFLSSVTPRRIFRMNNNIKLILAVREPVERLLSDFSQRCV